MVIDFGSSLGSLRMGVDIAPYTDPETVPHTRTPGHIPEYALERYDKGVTRWVFHRSGDIVSLVDEAHLSPDSMRLTEDGHLVFTAL